MSQQLQITGGAKVRDLQDVIIGTSGVLSSLAFNVANGVPKLDSNGKILVSQLPNSVMEYQGTWNANTNTPTLVNGTGNQGDFYLCNVAGTTNFGAGPLTFAVGDSAIYSGSIWQKAGGATGTVTSVGLTSTGNDAITITGSPITTSGNINLGFAGTNLQYINGTGDLTTFPTLISSIGLTMPSAFSVANSPLTANGTIAVTGAGNASQYIRGDGTLAAYNPSTGGGGSSVSYYLNGGTNQGTFVGNTYYEMSKTAVIGTGVDFTINANGYISQFITDANDPAQLVIPAGNWNFEMYFSASSSGGSPSFYVELYKYNGSTFTLIADNSANPEYITNGTAIDLYTTSVAVPETSLTITDRLAIRVYVTHASKTITLHTQDSHLCQVITTFSTGITALNGLTAQVQYFATGTSGSDFNISSATATHTFNIPDASASARGLITTGTQTIAGAKTFTSLLNVNNKIYLQTDLASTGVYFQSYNSNELSIGATSGATVYYSSFILQYATRSYTLPNADGTLALTSQLTSGTVTSVAALTLGTTGTDVSSTVANSTTTPVITLNIPDASALARGLITTGVQTIAGLKAFNDAITGNSGIAFLNGVMPPITSSYYSGIGGNSQGISIITRPVSTNYTNNLYFPSASNSYTFPNATGTVALTSNLSSYVPYTGATTSVNLGLYDLTALYLAVSQDGDSVGGYINFKQCSSVNNGSIGNTNIFAKNSTQFGINYMQSSGLNKTAIFDASSITTGNVRTFTFPDASGTLALTSSLSGYLPLTGGTLTGGLYINPTNTGVVGLDVASDTIRFRSDNLEGYKRQLEMVMGSGTLIQLTAKGYGGTYGTDLAFYTSSASGVNGSPAMYITGGNNIGIGTGSPSQTLDVIGTGRFSTGNTTTLTLGTIASGGTATSTPTLILMDSYFGNNVAGKNFKLKLFSATGSLNDDYGIGVSAANFELTAGNGASFNFYNNATTPINLFTIKSTGNVGIGTSSPSRLLTVLSSSDGITAGISGATYGIRFDNGGTFSSGMSTIHGVDSTLTGSYQPIMINGSDVRFGTGATERMRITSGGALYVNQTSSSAAAAGGKMQVAADILATGSSAGFFWENRSGGVTYNTNWYGWYTTGGTIFLYNGSANAASINPSTGAYVPLSDINKKKDFEASTIGLEAILGLKPTLYRMKSDDESLSKELGFIAQEVKEFIPQAYTEQGDDGDKFIGLNYQAITATLVKAIQEQNQTIQELSNRLIKLESK